jgi:hypothetical protein
MRTQANQNGRSIIGLIIILAIIAYGTYIGVQYIPQYVESSAVGSILNSVAKSHKTKPFSNPEAVRNAIDKQLDVNQLYDLRDSFIVIPAGNTFTIKSSYERELNLVYTQKTMQYEKSIILK